MPLEIELKLRIAPEDINQVYVQPLLTEYARAEPVTQQLSSTYFDTHDHRLRQNGLSLRLRDIDGVMIQAVKNSGVRVGDLYRRQEWEQEIKQQVPNIASISDADLQVQLLDLIGNDSLVPLFKTVFSRTTWQLYLPDGTEVEFALDQGQICTETKSEALHEIELELKTGDEAKLSELAALLQAKIPLEVEQRSKASRGYRLCML